MSSPVSTRPFIANTRSSMSLELPNATSRPSTRPTMPIPRQRRSFLHRCIDGMAAFLCCCYDRPANGVLRIPFEPSRKRQHRSSSVTHPLR